jgi:hypothetical protein
VDKHCGIRPTPAANGKVKQSKLEIQRKRQQTNKEKDNKQTSG